MALVPSALPTSPYPKTVLSVVFIALTSTPACPTTTAGLTTPTENLNIDWSVNAAGVKLTTTILFTASITQVYSEGSKAEMVGEVVLAVERHTEAGFQRKRLSVMRNFRTRGYVN